jgi:hypothetical protein
MHVLTLVPYPLPIKRPDLERKQYRLWLNREVMRAAGFIIAELEIPTDASLVNILGDGSERSNYEAIVSTIHRAVNQAMGKDKSNSKRNSWTLDELNTARRSVARVRYEVLSNIRERIEEGRN